MAQVEQQDWPKPAYAWYALTVISIGYIFAFIDRIVIGILTPDIIKSLHLTDTQMGLLQGLAFALFYTVFGIPLGWIADRGNRQRILSAGMTVWSVMTAACGLPTTFWPLFGARVGVGIGEATLGPCASSLIADWFPPEKRAKAFGFYTTATALAAIISYLMASLLLAWLGRYPVIDLPLVGAREPWQVVFIALGVLGLLPTALFAFTVVEPVRRGMVNATQAVAAGTWAFLRANAVTLSCLMVGASLIILEVYATVQWVPTYYLRTFGWSPAKTGFYLAILQSPCGLVSAFVSGYVVDWLKARGIKDAVWMLMLAGAIGCTVFGGLAPLMPAPELAMALFMMKALFVNFVPVGALAAMADVTPNQHRGFVVSLYVIMTGLFAQGAGPLMVGVLTDSVFHDPKAIGQSLALLVGGTGVVGLALLLWGRAAYGRSLAAVSWEQAPEPKAASAR